MESSFASSLPDGSSTAAEPRAEWEKIPWPDPTPEMLAHPLFNAIWNCIKGWDVNVPAAYVGYSGASGNHVRAIMDAIEASADFRESRYSVGEPGRETIGWNFKWREQPLPQPVLVAVPRGISVTLSQFERAISLYLPPTCDRELFGRELLFATSLRRTLFGAEVAAGKENS